jgi:hypothetical protein
MKHDSIRILGTVIFATFSGAGLLFAQDLRENDMKTGGDGTTAVEKEEEVSPQALLEGEWGAYDATGLTVRRSISVERDGEVYQANVFTPVLTRRGAVFLSGGQVSEMHAISAEIQNLSGEMDALREKARLLGERYSKLIGEARASTVQTVDAEEHRGRVEFTNRETN